MWDGFRKQVHSRNKSSASWDTGRSGRWVVRVAATMATQAKEGLPGGSLGLGVGCSLKLGGGSLRLGQGVTSSIHSLLKTC